ncbi:MAG TPA: hypothetical protein VEL31_13420, partial [Ktedonobacteraceae bacterium]|nr:hypothetical protein [Ktedonobacteraceae bacterium]
MGPDKQHLVQKLMGIAFDPDEENEPGIAHIALRTHRAFDVERATTRFYERFQQEHAIFLKFIQ